MVFSIQNSDFSTRIASLYGSQPSSVVFACKTAPFGSELQVSMGPRPHLSLCACKTTSLASESLVSMCPSPHLWFLQAKQRLKDQNNKSLWVPALICGFYMQNRDFWMTITSLYGSQTSPVDLCMQINVISIRNTSLYKSQPSSVGFACKTAPLGPELQVSWVPNLTNFLLHSKQRLYHQNCKSLWVPALICRFCTQNIDFWIRITSHQGS